MDLREIFEDKIKIEPKVMSIESLFMNEERVARTDYKPYYQRNYVWDDEKATYFIESILLGTEIPPLIYFRNPEKVEIIDGRQRYETIMRFKNNEFKLRKNGLQKLDNIGIANKLFRDLEPQLQDLFWDTKLRIIEFSFHSQKIIDEENEELVKKAIFKRYNSGITPLKPTEIDNAVYFEDDLNAFFKRNLLADKILFREISDIFYFEKTSIEVILKKIRQQLVQHKIPIKYYAVNKDMVISRFYDFSFENLEESEIQIIYAAFIEKINLIKKVKSKLTKDFAYNRLISECLIWAFSILEISNLTLKQVITDPIIDELATYIRNNIGAFVMDRSSFAKELYTRYLVTSNFFAEKFAINFDIYLYYNADFKQTNKETTPQTEERKSFDDLRINKPEPSSIAIVDIVRQMGRQRFLIRPPYQRKEVINKKKSSAIIESILLGIKLPPIFVYKRKDQISEVLDGQQRLLSILGFICETYLDENNKIAKSEKHGFALNLKNGILKHLNGKTFKLLDPEYKDKIKNFDLWVIEIDYKNNTNFEPIDLFIRLNNKPYPIKDDTFEMWNSYISRDIIDTIKSVHQNHSSWFYIRKNNQRMENENIYTVLSYFQYNWNEHLEHTSYAPYEVEVYKVVNKIYLRARSKNEITKVLEDTSKKANFIDAVNELEFNFIKKLRVLLSDNNDDSAVNINKNLDEIFIIENGRRTQQGFYALWLFLFNIPLEVIQTQKLALRRALKTLISQMSNINAKEEFDTSVNAFKEQYQAIVNAKGNMPRTYMAELGEIASIETGIAITQQKSNNLFRYPYISKNDLVHFSVQDEDIIYVDASEVPKKEFFDLKNKILISKSIRSATRLSSSFAATKLAYSKNVVGLAINRYGFSYKYVFCIIYCRYTFYNLHVKLNTKDDDIKNLTVSDVRNISIPILSLQAQIPFNLIFDYLINTKNFEIKLFLERIIDAMVYEIYFPDQFSQYNVTIAKSILDLSITHDSTKDLNETVIDEAYKMLSQPSSQLSASLLKMLGIPEIQSIEKSPY